MNKRGRKDLLLGEVRRPPVMMTIKVKGILDKCPDPPSWRVFNPSTIVNFPIVETGMKKIPNTGIITFPVNLVQQSLPI